jgi:hypothetical protein
LGQAWVQNAYKADSFSDFDVMSGGADILIRREDLDRFKQQHLGSGWVDKFEGSKNFRDTVCNVDIDVLIVGEYPGDGLPKPIAFPAPEDTNQQPLLGAFLKPPALPLAANCWLSLPTNQ